MTSPFWIYTSIFVYTFQWAVLCRSWAVLCRSVVILLYITVYYAQRRHRAAAANEQKKRTRKRCKWKDSFRYITNLKWETCVSGMNKRKKKNHQPQQQQAASNSINNESSNEMLVIKNCVMCFCSGLGEVTQMLLDAHRFYYSLFLYFFFFSFVHSDSESKLLLILWIIYYQIGTVGQLKHNICCAYIIYILQHMRQWLRVQRSNEISHALKQCTGPLNIEYWVESWDKKRNVDGDDDFDSEHGM